MVFDGEEYWVGDKSGSINILDANMQIKSKIEKKHNHPISAI